MLTIPALKGDDIKQLKEKFGFNPEEKFAVSDDVYNLYHGLSEKGAKVEATWNDLFKKYGDKYPTEASELQRRMEGRLPEGWEKALPTYSTSDAAVGSRKLSESTITKLAEVLPELIGGSADLTGSNLTRWKGAEDFQHPSTGLGSYKGRYFRFGVREHGMNAIANGLAAYGGIIPFVATFLNFVSYAAGAVRLSALSHFRVLNVATHDSIGLGEDGPTHQPVETAAWLRATPNLAFWRPADGNETSATYLVALKSQHTPSVMAFSRQNVRLLSAISPENPRCTDSCSCPSSPTRPSRRPPRVDTFSRTPRTPTSPLSRPVPRSPSVSRPSRSSLPRASRPESSRSHVSRSSYVVSYPVSIEVSQPSAPLSPRRTPRTPLTSFPSCPLAHPSCRSRHTRHTAGALFRTSTLVSPHGVLPVLTTRCTPSLALPQMVSPSAPQRSSSSTRSEASPSFRPSSRPSTRLPSRV